MSENCKSVAVYIQYTEIHINYFVQNPVYSASCYFTCVK